MQSDHKQVYKLTSQRTGKSEQMYKDLGNFVFTEVYNLLRKPKSLILKLKGVGSWHLRKKRMEIIVQDCPDRGLVKTREDFESDGSWNEYLDKHIQYNIFKERLLDYDEYLTIKKQVREKRNETQVLLVPSEDNEKFKSE